MNLAFQPAPQPAQQEAELRAQPRASLTQDRPRVLVVYRHLPHYRYDVFDQLQQESSLDVEYAAGQHSLDGSIPGIPDGVLHVRHRLRNATVGRFAWQWGVLRLILRRRPDVVIFQGTTQILSTWVATVLARLLGMTVLYWTIGWRRPERGLHRLLKLAFFRLAHGLLLYGPTGRRIGLAMGYPADRMRVIYNSSSAPAVSEHKAATAIHAFVDALPTGEEEIVGAVVRLRSAKRLDLLIEAAARLRATGRPVGVLLVGEGPERDRLDDLARRLDVPLYLPGPAYSDLELQAFYAHTMVTVVPSMAGLTVLQSLKFGCPVITHDNMDEQVPECEAIVPGVTGDLYRYGDVDDLAAQLERWLDHQREHQEETAQRCRDAIVDCWSAEAQARIIASEIHRYAGRHSADQSRRLPQPKA